MRRRRRRTTRGSRWAEVRSKSGRDDGCAAGGGGSPPAASGQPQLAVPWQHTYVRLAEMPQQIPVFRHVVAPIVPSLLHEEQIDCAQSCASMVAWPSVVHGLLM